jgi:hypothetical protein
MQSLKRSADKAGFFGTGTPLDPFTFDDSSDEGTAAKRHQEDTDSKMEAARREYYGLAIEHHESGKIPLYPFILKLHTPHLFMNHVIAECERFNGTVDLAHATAKIIEHDITGPKAVDMSRTDWREKLGMKLGQVAQIRGYVRAAGDVSDSDKELAALELAESQAAAKDRRERAEKEKAQAAAAKAAEEAKEAERKRQEELEKAEQINKAKRERIAELEKKALQRKAEAMGLPTTDLIVNKGTRYEETYKVVWAFVGPLANGAPINDGDMIEKLEGFLSTDKSYKDTWGRLVSEGIQLFSIQYGKVDGNWVLRVTYDGYVPDYNDECPYDDDQSDGDDWEEKPCFSYFDVDMYGRVEDFDAPNGCYVKAFRRNESKGWVTIHSD